VTGVCSTSGAELVRGLGASHVVDYTRTDFSSGDERYDVILDIGGNTPVSKLRRALAPRGTLPIVGGEGGGELIGGVHRHRWAQLLSPFGLGVMAYVGLLTDEYPPFRIAA
jgi:NADPH:quinone reductase-like Zn-dependent oxidoreductase